MDEEVSNPSSLEQYQYDDNLDLPTFGKGRLVPYNNSDKESGTGDDECGKEVDGMESSEGNKEESVADSEVDLATYSPVKKL